MIDLHIVDAARIAVIRPLNYLKMKTTDKDQTKKPIFKSKTPRFGITKRGV